MITLNPKVRGGIWRVNGDSGDVLEFAPGVEVRGTVARKIGLDMVLGAEYEFTYPEKEERSEEFIAELALAAVLPLKKAKCPRVPSRRTSLSPRFLTKTPEPPEVVYIIKTRWRDRSDSGGGSNGDGPGHKGD